MLLEDGQNLERLSVTRQFKCPCSLTLLATEIEGLVLRVVVL